MAHTRRLTTSNDSKISNAVLFAGGLFLAVGNSLIAIYKRGLDESTLAGIMFGTICAAPYLFNKSDECRSRRASHPKESNVSKKSNQTKTESKVVKPANQLSNLRIAASLNSSKSSNGVSVAANVESKEENLKGKIDTIKSKIGGLAVKVQTIISDLKNKTSFGTIESYTKRKQAILDLLVRYHSEYSKPSRFLSLVSKRDKNSEEQAIVADDYNSYTNKLELRQKEMETLLEELETLQQQKLNPEWVANASGSQRSSRRR